MVEEILPPSLRCVPTCIASWAPFFPNRHMFLRAAPGWCSPQNHATVLRPHAGVQDILIIDTLNALCGPGFYLGPRLSEGHLAINRTRLGWRERGWDVAEDPSSLSPKIQTPEPSGIRALGLCPHPAHSVRQARHHPPAWERGLASVCVVAVGRVRLSPVPEWPSVVYTATCTASS
ncbi:hypothetical protein chiPu_0028930, partial [Chiloscyllium punctatum]|nr:hypothetical protein [Chiloscyllium punctatum]